MPMPTDTQRNPKNPFQAAFLRNNFFQFQRLLRRDNNIEKLPKLFKELSELKLTVFETILLSKEEKSAKFICLIWDELRLWNHSKILFMENEITRMLPVDYAVESTNITNLFSFLVFDWHNPDQHILTKGKKYFLEIKNNQLMEKTGRSLFQHIYKIIESDDSYQEVCLRIVYEYFHEMEERLVEEKKIKQAQNRSDEKFSEKNQIKGRTDFERLIAIDEVLSMKNEECREKLLESFVTYLLTLYFDVELFKMKILPELVTKSQNPFFKLALQLIERKTNKFETNFNIYLEKSKHEYGNYFETAVKPMARLLIKIAEAKTMSQVQAFIYYKCPQLEINSTPLTNFEELYRFNDKNIFPMNPKEAKAFVSGGICI